MSVDPRKLRPSELCRLLNSTPLGELISERQLYRHRQRAGNRIGDGKTIDLLRYCAWMHVLSTPIPTPDGWTSMGKIRAGDIVFDEFGSQCRVLYKSPIEQTSSNGRITQHLGRTAESTQRLRFARNGLDALEFSQGLGGSGLEIVDGGLLL